MAKDKDIEAAEGAAIDMDIELIGRLERAAEAVSFIAAGELKATANRLAESIRSPEAFVRVGPAKFQSIVQRVFDLSNEICEHVADARDGISRMSAASAAKAQEHMRGLEDAEAQAVRFVLEIQGFKARLEKLQRN